MANITLTSRAINKCEVLLEKNKAEFIEVMNKDGDTLPLYKEYTRLRSLYSRLLGRLDFLLG